MFFEIAGIKNEIKILFTKRLDMETQTITKTKRQAKKGTGRSNGTLRPATKKKEVEKDLSKTYNEFKEFEGQHYTGMRVGVATNGITTRSDEVMGEQRSKTNFF